MAKFDELKQMREQRDGAKTADEKAAEEARVAESKRLLAGESVGGDAPDPDDDVETENDETEVETAPDGDGDETVTVREHERKKPDVKKDEQTVAPPGTEAVEIDGVTVYVAPDLAAAYRDAEAHKAEVAKQEAHDKLVEDVAARVAKTLPQAPAGKTEADLAAERALAAIDNEPEKHPMPASELAITDPAAYDAQLKAHIDEKAERTAKRAVAESERRNAEAQRDAQAKADAQRETQAREILGNQFYEKYKVLADPGSKALVDVLLEKKWDEVRERLRTNPPKTAAEGEAFKQRCFADVAAEATRQIVRIRQGATAAAPPPPTPPMVAQSKAREVGKKPTPAPEKPKEKYPEGSVSSMLARHKQGKEGPSSKSA